MANKSTPTRKIVIIAVLVGALSAICVAGLIAWQGYRTASIFNQAFQ